MIAILDYSARALSRTAAVASLKRLGFGKMVPGGTISGCHFLIWLQTAKDRLKTGSNYATLFKLDTSQLMGTIHPKNQSLSQKSKILKYSDQISLIQFCPPIACKKTTITGYRFVFDDAEPAPSFTPVGLLNPGQIEGLDEKKKCSSFGLSFFNSANNAEEHFNRLQKRIPLIHKKLGGNLAEVNITPKHGLVSEPIKDTGHFTVHEELTAVWKWEIIKQLI